MSIWIKLVSLKLMLDNLNLRQPCGNPTQTVASSETHFNERNTYVSSAFRGN